MYTSQWEFLQFHVLEISAAALLFSNALIAICNKSSSGQQNAIQFL